MDKSVGLECLNALSPLLVTFIAPGYSVCELGEHLFSYK